MSRFRADWIVPIAGQPIVRGWVEVHDGRIAAMGDGVAADALDLGHAAILPALVNAHTHLELSYLRGLVPRAERFVDWVRVLLRARRDHTDPAAQVILDAARMAIDDLRATGTGLVGDVCNTLITPDLLRAARMPAQVFYELLGFSARDPEQLVRDARAKSDAVRAGDPWVRISLAPHAPYSVSAALFAAIRADLDACPGQVSTVHLGESAEEVEFIERGTGAWRTLLEDLGAWIDGWQPPRTTPVEYLDGLGFLDCRVLVVHGVQFSGEDLDRLRALGVTIVSCPRSNRYVGVGSPPLEAFYAMNVQVAFGTDSLASVEDLNLFSELAEARRLAPRVPAAALLESATLSGARALGFEPEFGSIEVGKSGSLIVVRLPEGVTDVEEYLLTGIQPGAISWLGTPSYRHPLM